MKNLTEIVSRLHGAKVQFVLIGGLAAVQHGASYATYAVDIVVPVEAENFLRIGKAVQDLNPRFRNRRALAFELTTEFLAELKNLYLMTDLGPLDCLGEVAGVGDYSSALEQSQPTELPFGQINILKIDPLVNAKEAIGRPQDLLVVTQLRASKEPVGFSNSLYLWLSYSNLTQKFSSRGLPAALAPVILN